ncbi:hypothetical protein FHS96_003217 [Sphingomonas zeicaulis]
MQRAAGTDRRAGIVPTCLTVPVRSGVCCDQNAALIENTTWLAAIDDPFLVDEKFGCR